MKGSFLPAVIHSLTTFDFFRQQSILSYMLWHSSEIIKTAIVVPSLSVYGRTSARGRISITHSISAMAAPRFLFVIATNSSFPLPTSFLPLFAALSTAVLAAGVMNRCHIA